MEVTFAHTFYFGPLSRRPSVWFAQSWVQQVFQALPGSLAGPWAGLCDATWAGPPRVSGVCPSGTLPTGRPTGRAAGALRLQSLGSRPPSASDSCLILGKLFIIFKPPFILDKEEIKFTC